MPQTVNGYTVPAGSDAVSTIDDTLATFAGQLPAQGFALGGLRFITAQTLTAASSLSVNSCFTSTYQNYLLTVDITALAASAQVNIRLRASGTDSTASVYKHGGWYSAMTTTGYNPTGGATYTTLAIGSGTFTSPSTAYPFVMAYTLVSPQQAVPTRITGAGIAKASEIYHLTESCYHDAATAYDGFTIYSTQNMTGTVRVYGYQNS